MGKVIFTDIDDTVLNFSDAIIEWVKKKGMEVTDITHRESLSLMKVLNCNRMKAKQIAYEFSVEYPNMARLAPEPDALEVLPKLHKQGYEFVGITSCVNTPDVIKWRTRNLEQAFGFKWKSLHCVGLENPKAGLLKWYDKSIWVEDNLTHAIAGSEAGHRTFLLDRPHNQTSDLGKITRVKNWMDIAAHLETNS